VPETRFRVASGGCLECGCNVEGKLQSLPGAEDVKILAGADVIMVQHDGRLDADTVRRAAAAHNLTLVGQDEPGVDQDRAWWGRRARADDRRRGRPIAGHAGVQVRAGLGDSGHGVRVGDRAGRRRALRAGG
jgi:hypothetical protein